MDRTISPFHAAAAAPPAFVPVGCATGRAQAGPQRRERPITIDSPSRAINVPSGPVTASPGPIAGPPPTVGDR